MNTDIDITWGQRQRFEFIEFKLYWEGGANRGDLVSRFGISMQQASVDFSRYAEVAPGNVAYNRHKKAFEPTATFDPRFVQPDADRYLRRLLGVTLGLHNESAFLDWMPEVDAVPLPRRSVPAHTLRGVLRAIRAGHALSIDYLSMPREQAQNTSGARTVSPHALAHDGKRWHMRAFCHRRGNFRDFVLSRVQHIHGEEAISINPADDLEWGSKVRVTLAPAPGLPAAQRSAVEHDYGMVNGIYEFEVRRALLFYALRQLGSELTVGPRQVVVVNEDELAPLIKSKS